MGKLKEVFIFVVGTSPQVITETIYSLALSRPPVYPDEIYVVTTVLGKQILIENLIKRNILNNLISEYSLPEIKLDEPNILIPFGRDNKAVEDICSYEDNDALGDLIISLVREKAKDEGARLHCSIAGGRKTMSFYLGAALQLFGRPWDRLYHVIVTPEFESHPDFYFKPKVDRDISIKTRDGQEIILNTSQAKIMLADLPFIRLGRKLNLRGKSFRELVREGQKEIDLSALQPEVSLNLSNRRVQVDDKTLILPSSLLFYYTVFLRQKTDFCLYTNKDYCLDCQDCYRELNYLFGLEKLKQYAADYARIFGEKPFKWELFLKKWKSGIPVEVCRQYLSKLNRMLKEELNNDTLWSLISINSIKVYAGSRYGLRLEKSKITIK
ncbi:MAG: TIGR02584 family CRISPR-associated protein [Candidatus Aminicenantes bacterium]|nr:TIGR02584 family CRISPR-associated protein [Candidatus Aminicenantes bacterium]